VTESEATVPAHTGSRTTRLLGLATLVGIAVVLVLGLVVTGPDAVQGDAARLIYLHVPVAVAMNVGFGLTTLGSVMWLWKKSRWWDTVAVSACEVGLVYTGLTLVTGMVWGRPTWGVYWTWDARLTTFSLLFLLYLGYLVVRHLPAETEVRNRRSAYVALLAFVDVPIVYLSVSWWRGLHQSATLSLSSTISGLMLFTLMTGMIVALMGFAWLLIHRFRVAWLEDELDSVGLELAISERRAEAGMTSVNVPATVEAVVR
jgi:heme exporter protein C